MAEHFTMTFTEDELMFLASLCANQVEQLNTAPPAAPGSIEDNARKSVVARCTSLATRLMLAVDDDRELTDEELDAIPDAGFEDVAPRNDTREEDASEVEGDANAQELGQRRAEAIIRKNSL